MHFLCNESDFKFHNNVVYFYSSKINILSDILYDYLNDLDKKIPIICIDLMHFISFKKRFNILEIPTLLAANNGKIKRISGFPSLKDFDDIGKLFDISTL